MRLVVQRVDRAIAQDLRDDQVLAEIAGGLVVYVGFSAGDTESQAVKAAHKVAHMRIIEQGESLFGRSLLDADGEALVLFQLPVVADMSRGRRPNFSGAASKASAEALYTRFIDALVQIGIPTVAGPMATRLRVTVVNRGPFTVPLEIG